MVTGAGGSLGQALIATLDAAEVDCVLFPTDKVFKGLERVDVSSKEEVATAVLHFRPNVIYHLAAGKHAPWGEEHPLEVVQDNVMGTYNVARAAMLMECIGVFASTCKAADPETVYGASKLIAERMALNAGHRVARFYNVPETQGNVFRIWEQTHAEGKYLRVTPCTRYFISSREAVSLLLACVVQPPGRYAFNPGEHRTMKRVAEDLYPGYPLTHVPRRRGDRERERLYAWCETFSEVKGRLYKITSPYDPP